MLEYICNKTAAPYFSNLVWFIGNHIIELDECLLSQAQSVTHLADHLLFIYRAKNPPSLQLLLPHSPLSHFTIAHSPLFPPSSFPPPPPIPQPSEPWAIGAAGSGAFGPPALYLRHPVSERG